MICCNGKELSQMVEKGDFGIVVLKDFNEKNFAAMIPMVLIRGVRKPLDIIEWLIMNMDEEL